MKFKLKERIRGLRKERCETQVQVAEALGIAEPGKRLEAGGPLRGEHRLSGRTVRGTMRREEASRRARRLLGPRAV